MSFGLARGRELEITGFGFTPADLPSLDAGAVDLRAYFPVDRRTLPLEIEIGSGKGTFLVQEGAARPGVNLAGMEWAGEFFRYAADRVRRSGLANVRLFNVDAGEFLKFRVAEGVCQALHIYFPDPWPKSRHHKRRIIQEKHLREFHRILQPEGQIRIVTDHPGYWEWMQTEVLRVGDVFVRDAFERPASAGEGEVVGTNFERKYRREGRPFHAMVLRKRFTNPGGTQS